MLAAAGIPQNALTVRFLDVGQGDAALIRTPDDVLFLIDGGPDNHVLTALGPALPWYRRHIDYVVITHADVDHYGGIFGVIEKYDVGTVLVNSTVDTDEYFNLLISEIKQKNIPIRSVSQGDALTLPSGALIEFLWPPSGTTDGSSNERSLVIMVSWRGREFLFTGDIGAAEEKLISTSLRRRVDVLKVSHHGSKTSTDKGFLSAIRPRYCIISAGRDNRYGHPHPTVMTRLKEANCLIFETVHGGTIVFGHDGTATNIATEL